MENQNKNGLIITRVFNAPVETVWRYFSEPEFYKWWGPKNFTAPVVKIDFKVGGKFLGCMRGAPVEGAPVQDFWSTGTYREIVPMKKIVVTDSFADENGDVVPSSHYGMEGMPMEMLVTFEFEEVEDGKTKMTLKHEGIANIPDEHRIGMEQGWNESFDKLSKIL